MRIAAWNIDCNLIESKWFWANLLVRGGLKGQDETHRAGTATVGAPLDASVVSAGAQNGRKVTIVERAAADWSSGGGLTSGWRVAGEGSGEGAGGWVGQFVAPTPQQFLS